MAVILGIVIARGANENTNGLLRQYFPERAGFLRAHSHQPTSHRRRAGRRLRVCPTATSCRRTLPSRVWPEAVAIVRGSSAWRLRPRAWTQAFQQRLLLSAALRFGLSLTKRSCSLPSPRAESAPGPALTDVAGRGDALATLLDELEVPRDDRSTTGITVNEEFEHTKDGRRPLG
jgi:hypothetical protein